jgi:hypothetical protein
MNQLIQRLKELVEQATTDRSHYYVKSVCLEAIDHIERQEKAIDVAKEWLSLIGGPVEFYDSQGERSKTSAAQGALKQIESILNNKENEK